MGFEGVMQKNMASKGGRPGKYGVWRGGSPKKFPLSLLVTASNNANISASDSKVLKIQIFPGGECPRTPLLYYTPNGNSTPPTVSLQNTPRGMSTLFGPLLV